MVMYPSAFAISVVIRTWFSYFKTIFDLRHLYVKQCNYSQSVLKIIINVLADFSLNTHQNLILRLVLDAKQNVVYEPYYSQVRKFSLH